MDSVSPRDEELYEAMRTSYRFGYSDAKVEQGGASPREQALEAALRELHDAVTIHVREAHFDTMKTLGPAMRRAADCLAAPAAQQPPAPAKPDWKYCTSRGYEIGEQCESAADCAKNGCALGRAAAQQPVADAPRSGDGVEGVRDHDPLRRSDA